MAGRHRVVRVTMCVASVGVLVCGAGAGGASAAKEQPAAPAEVDLYLVRGGAELVPGGVVERAMTVVNHGQDMTGNVELYYTTPFFINIDEQKSMPPGCGMYHVNKDYYIPEIVKCTLSPLKAGGRHELAIPVKVSEGAPPRPTYGTAIVRPARPDQDRERNITDNVASPGGTVSLPPLTSGRQPARSIEGAHLAMLHTTAIVGLQPSMSDYSIKNLGTEPAKDLRFIVVTPLYVNTSTAGPLPAGCSMVLTDPDPAVPEIVECDVANIAAGQSYDIRIPLKTVPHGPQGAVYGAAVLATRNPDPTTSFCGTKHYEDFANDDH